MFGRLNAAVLLQLNWLAMEASKGIPVTHIFTSTEWTNLGRGKWWSTVLGDHGALLSVRSIFRWIVTAVAGHREKSAQLSLEGDFGSIVQASVNGSLTQTHDSGYISRSGPPTEKGTGDQHKNKSALKYNQCIFMHYYKMKKRLRIFPTILKAAAEPKDPDTGPPDDDNDFEIEQVPSSAKPYDPVGEVLDYILEHAPEATSAIASDFDLRLLCKDNDIPDDIPTFLQESQPQIEVNENGLGMLSFDDETVAQYQLRFSVPVAQLDSNPSSDAPIHESASLQTAAEEVGGRDDRSATSDHNKATDHVQRGTLSSPEEGHPPHQPDHTEESSKLMAEAALQPSVELVPPEKAGMLIAVEVSPNGQFAVAGFEGSISCTWDNEVMNPLPAHEDIITAIAFSRDGTLVATGSRDKRIIVHHVPSLEREITLEGHTNLIKDVAFSPDKELLVSGSVDFTVRLWSLTNGRKLAEGHHDAMVMKVGFSPDGTRFVSASADSTVCIWSTEDGAAISVLHGHMGVIHAMSFSSDGRRIVTGSDDGKAKVWSAVSGDCFVTIDEKAGVVRQAMFSPDDQYVLTAGTDMMARVNDSYTGERVQVIEGGLDLQTATTFTLDGKYVAAGGHGNAINIWNTDTGDRVAQFLGHQDTVTCIRFSADGLRVVSYSEDNVLLSWKVRDAIVTPPAAPLAAPPEEVAEPVDQA
ncbi:hypothetical WD-repeat protein [Postia placenta Mad-698-R]|nr:hypothetical WD-repeat protein [Postia placenta Mad-698-R]